MSMVESPVPMPQRAPAKGRILATANDLFYEDGIRNVGVDRIISASSVTKATFYKHFRAKDNLIVEYVTARHHATRQNLTSIVERHADPAQAIREIVARIVDEIGRDGFRGCPFLNAAAEFPDPEHPVRQIVSTHRDWYTDLLATLMRGVGHPRPGDAADDLMLARDGAMTGGYAGDAIAAAAALNRAADRVLDEAR